MCVWDRIMFVENRTDVFCIKGSYKNKKEIIANGLIHRYRSNM